MVVFWPFDTGQTQVLKPLKNVTVSTAPRLRQESEPLLNRIYLCPTAIPQLRPLTHSNGLFFLAIPSSSSSSSSFSAAAAAAAAARCHHRLRCCCTCLVYIFLNSLSLPLTPYTANIIIVPMPIPEQPPDNAVQLQDVGRRPTCKPPLQH